MRYRVYFEGGIYSPTHYFKTKKEAVEFQNKYGGVMQRKVGRTLFDY